MCTLPDTPGKKRFSSVLWNASGGGGKKFVAINSRRHAAAPIVRLDAQHPRVTAYVHIARQRDLLGQSRDKLDRSSCLHARFNQKIKSAKTYVARFALPFQDIVFLRKSHFQRQHHRKTACGAAFFGTVHQPSRGPLRLRQAIIASRLAAMSFTHPVIGARRTFEKLSRRLARHRHAAHSPRKISTSEFDLPRPCGKVRRSLTSLAVRWEVPRKA